MLREPDLAGNTLVSLIAAWPCLAAAPQRAFADEAKLLREPDLAGNTLVFTYARDIWKTTLDGGDALRLTSFQGREATPRISPDGQMVAFTGEYEGNLDIYVVSISGGAPRRLTYHPGDDLAVGSGRERRPVFLRAARCAARMAAALHDLTGGRHARGVADAARAERQFLRRW